MDKCKIKCKLKYNYEMNYYLMGTNHLNINLMEVLLLDKTFLQIYDFRQRNEH